MIYLREVSLLRDTIEDANAYPFCIPAIEHLETLALTTDVTFFVGENGSGKSTLLEAIAQEAGFNPKGGSANHIYEGVSTESSLSDFLRLSWLPRTHRGFFLRAESFFNFASYVDQVEQENPGKGMIQAYGGTSLHAQSHGESFMILASHRFKHGLIILDEPEAALSPTRQLSLLRVIHDMLPKAQFLIATHSPILLAFPGAKIFSCSSEGIKPVTYEETEHYQVYRSFLEHPARYIKHLFAD